jgi:hypothetical protein
MSLDVCGLVAEVKNKPQLKTRIREREPDAVRLSQLKRLWDARMLVAIEDAPKLIVCTSTLPLRIASFALLCINRLLDHLKRRDARRIYLDVHPLAVASMPIFDVLIFRLALHEDEKLKPDGSARCTSLRRPTWYAPSHL